MSRAARVWDVPRFASCPPDSAEISEQNCLSLSLRLTWLCGPCGFPSLSRCPFISLELLCHIQLGEGTGTPVAQLQPGRLAEAEVELALMFSVPHADSRTWARLLELLAGWMSEGTERSWCPGGQQGLVPLPCLLALQLDQRSSFALVPASICRLSSLTHEGCSRTTSSMTDPAP